MHPDHRLFELGEHPTGADKHLQIFGIATLEGLALDRSGEIHRHEVVVLGCTLDRFEGRALLSQHLDGLVDLGIGDLENRPADFGIDYRPHGHFGINLERRTVFVRRAAIAGGFGFEFGIAGDAKVVVPHGVTETLLQAVREDFLTDLQPVLLFHDLHRDFSRPEAVHLDRLRQATQTS